MMLGPVVALAAAALSFEPPQLTGGAVPGTPARDVGGGEVWLELQVSSTGAVDHVVTLRETPPYTEEMQRLVKGWSFQPAREGGMPVDGRVLVIAQFRPPTLLGGAIGQPPQDVASASAAVAAPLAAPMPGYPAEAEGDGTVLLQANVGADGKVQTMRTIRGWGPFQSMALDAVRGWTFRPATRDGISVPSVVCVVMSFRSPAVGPTEVPGEPPPPLPPPPQP